jgi:hypothetical protein
MLGNSTEKHEKLFISVEVPINFLAFDTII